MSFYVIQLNSFLHEWNRNFNSTEEVKCFKKKFKPLIEAIASFEDIKYARNTILAHNRDQKQNHASSLLQDRDINYDIPVATNDLMFVSSLLKVLQVEMRKTFKQEFDNLEAYRLDSSKIKEVKGKYSNLDEALAAIEVVKKKCSEDI